MDYEAQILVSSNLSASVSEDNNHESAGCGVENVVKICVDVQILLQTSTPDLACVFACCIYILHKRHLGHVAASIS